MERGLCELALLGESQTPLILRLLGFGIDQHRLPKMGDCLIPIAPLPQNQSEIGVRLGVARITLKSATEMLNRLAELPLASKKEAETGVRRAETRAQAQRIIKLFEGVPQVPLNGKGKPQRAVRVGIVGL